MTNYFIHISLLCRIVHLFKTALYCYSRRFRFTAEKFLFKILLSLQLVNKLNELSHLNKRRGRAAAAAGYFIIYASNFFFFTFPPSNFHANRTFPSVALSFYFCKVGRHELAVNLFKKCQKQKQRVKVTSRTFIRITSFN